MEMGRKPSWMLRHQQNLELISQSRVDSKLTKTFNIKPTPADQSEEMSSFVANSENAHIFRPQTLLQLDAELPTELSVLSGGHDTPEQQLGDF